MRTSLDGGCHCGALKVHFESEVPIGELVVRACQCAFCRRHAQRSITDPKGFARITAEEKLLSRYQFGLYTADLLVCAHCGVYVGATMYEPRTLATINLNVFDERDAFAPAIPMDYSAEDVDTRLTRRAARWTPAELVLAP